MCLFWDPGWGAQAAVVTSVKSQVQAYVAFLWLQGVATAVRGSDLVDSWLLLGKKLGRKRQAGIVLPAGQRGGIQATFKHSTRTMSCQHSWGACRGARWINNSIMGQLGSCCSPLNWQSANFKVGFCGVILHSRAAAEAHSNLCGHPRMRQGHKPWQLQWDWGYSLSPHGQENSHQYDFFSIILF